MDECLKNKKISLVKDSYYSYICLNFCFHAIISFVCVMLYATQENHLLQWNNLDARYI
ncbi:MAG: hypothetical protein XD92_0889 [Proteiniphilum acetatigenes]|jgi:hypothetical protein|uniref:Uncharacterized protein n=1 Tax=Proteiniphilum acetatigenes TaxID=294710 RepID=A0A124FX81_9BACT|nr:MAG: hypothetical protein XD92_0889 [Proteiniphilum acetatigenes]MBZ4652202.1 hypothetical protein [Proteiniphilum sp.]MDK2851938.1 hypothetical protein [Proteiniphilum sp.]